MKFAQIIPCLAAFLTTAATSFAVPSSITAPVEGSIRLGSASAIGFWVFNQHAAGFHTSAGGIGSADDRMAWDVNLYETGNSNADAGKPVYAIADGYIDTVVRNWIGSTAGQLLIRHTDSAGNTYYSGYLHMTNIITKTNNSFVRAGTIIGRVGRTGATNDHLHFAVYDMSGGKLISRNASIVQRSAVTPVAPPAALTVTALSSNRVDLDWADTVGTGIGYRIQIAPIGSSWTAANGFSSPAVSQAVTPSAYTWTTPTPGQTYEWCVRVNDTRLGASDFSARRSFTVPQVATTPALSLSSTTLTASTTQNSSPSAASFTIRNSGNGTLSYTASTTSSWMSISPGSGTSTGESDSINVNFNTSGYNAGTLSGTITVNGGSAGTQNITVNVTITAPPVNTVDDHGNFTWNATSLSVNGSLAGNLERGGDEDMFRVNIQTAGTVNFFSTGNIDTYGHLYNANGGEIASNDDDNQNAQFLISTFLNAGTYYLKVRGYNTSSTTGAYRVNVTATTPPAPTDDHGNNTWNATNLHRYSSLAGNLEQGGDVDMFRIEVASYGNVSFFTTGSNIVDTYGHLYNASGAEIASNDDDYGNNQFIITTYLSPGTYYLKVRGYSNNTTGAYRVYAN